MQEPELQTEIIINKNNETTMYQSITHSIVDKVL